MFTSTCLPRLYFLSSSLPSSSVLFLCLCLCSSLLTCRHYPPAFLYLTLLLLLRSRLLRLYFVVLPLFCALLPLFTSTPTCLLYFHLRRSLFTPLRSKYLDGLPSNRYTFSLQSSRSGDWTRPSTVVGRIPVRRWEVKDTKSQKMHLLWEELVLKASAPCGTTQILRVK